ncbi:MAG: Fe3+-siderophores ABC transporter protein [Gammaproteobacteria bacterium]|mgnify:FL=1|nr:Fe3+-siderophores ABC transporter protein [Gammaproteobacteria bacterium]
MRVISLVPSLTETLVECGLEVVGRTRFCIHPEEVVRDIPVVGGTKGVNWDSCRQLKPDLVVMDREENTLQMAESCPFPWHATHITSVGAVGDDLQALAGKLQSHKLEKLSADWQSLAGMPNLDFTGWDNLPGLMHSMGSIQDIARINYMIWQDPWMTISRSTFIGSVLIKTGLGHFLPDYSKPYPALTDSRLPEANTFYLFSSEPFPFARHIEGLEGKGFNGALVDGEFFSWFGIRSYRMLRDYMEKYR